MIPVCIKKLHPDAVIPTFATKGSAGADIYAIKDITLFPNEIIRLSTGIALSITRGYEIQIRARSSMASKGIIIPNSPATIDCLAGSTKIKLLDNTEDTLQNIVSRVNNGEILYTYSIDDKTGVLAPGLITHAVNKGIKDVIKITFDSGTSIICTPSHEFRDFKGNYTKAKDLHIGSRVCSTNFHYDKDGHKRHTSLRYGKIGKNEYVHRQIYESYNNLTQDIMPELIHHINRIPADNTPNNLHGMTFKDHSKLHQDADQTFAQWRQTDKFKEHIKDFGKRVAYHPNRLKAIKESPNKKGFIGHETEEHKDKIRQAQIKAWKNVSQKRLDAIKKKKDKNLQHALLL